MIEKLAKFFGLVICAVIAVYYVPPIIGWVFHMGTLVAYFRAKPKDEPFWMAYFLLLSDGFFGFFGLYEAVISLLPGLPPIELGQVYIILSVIKARAIKADYQPFYWPPLMVMGIYLIFLVVQGYVLGVEMELNVQFRILKWLTPLLLFYSVPRLFKEVEQYKELFVYLFPMAFVTLGAQLFTIMLGRSPMQVFGIKEKVWFAIQVSSEKTYRGFYNDNVIIITYFGALYFLAIKKFFFRNIYLFAVLGANFASVFLSATRGWTIFSVFILSLSFALVIKFDKKRVSAMFALLIVAIIGTQSVPILRTQVNNAVRRMLTLEALAEGDATADGTLIRLTERGPRVMKKWSQSKLTGWGFSNGFMESDDFHVGNQNILMHSGIIGALLMAIFIGFFILKQAMRWLTLPRDHLMRDVMLLCPIFFMGWFIIHSSSQQEFSYYQFPGPGIIQAAFFSLAALSYQLTLNTPKDDGEQAIDG